MFRTETSEPQRIIVTANNKDGTIWVPGGDSIIRHMDLITLTELRDALNGAIAHIEES